MVVCVENGGGLVGHETLGDTCNVAQPTTMPYVCVCAVPAYAQVRAVLEAAVEAEGSSSEDTSDEAFERLHAPLLEEERIRLNPQGGCGWGVLLGGGVRV